MPAPACEPPLVSLKVPTSFVRNGNINIFFTALAKLTPLFRFRGVNI